MTTLKGLTRKYEPFSNSELTCGPRCANLSLLLCGGEALASEGARGPAVLAIKPESSSPLRGLGGEQRPHLELKS